MSWSFVLVNVLAVASSSLSTVDKTLALSLFSNALEALVFHSLYRWLIKNCIASGFNILFICIPSLPDKTDEV
jgi:hypothetical protein